MTRKQVQLIVSYDENDLRDENMIHTIPNRFLTGIRWIAEQNGVPVKVEYRWT